MLPKRFLRASVVALSMAGGTFAPGVAQAGFFEQLFGMQSPTYSPAPNDAYVARPSERVPHIRRKKHVAIAEAKPGRQTPTDIMHDSTLRSGDAVMTKTGIHIFEGDHASRHDHDDFVAVDDAGHVSRKQRDALLAIDTTRNDPLRGNISPDTIASGRSASVSTPTNAGYRITDARGKSVRYVGP